MEIHCQAGWRIAERCQQQHQRMQQRQTEQAAEYPHQRIAQRQPFGHIAICIEQRRQRAADVRTEHQSQRSLCIDDMGGGQRNDQQYHRYTRMTCPGEHGGHQHGQQRLVGQRLQHGVQRRGVLHRGQRHHQQMQSQQHQTEPDRHPADVFVTRVVAAAMDHEADQHQHRRHQRDIERKQLHYQRAADVGTEHHRQARRQSEEATGREGHGHHAGGGTALQQRGDAHTETKRRRAVTQVAAQPAAQGTAVSAQYAAGDHMGTPQEQGDVTCDIEQDQGSVHGTSLRA